MKEILALGYVYRTEIKGVLPALEILRARGVSCYFLTTEEQRKLVEGEKILCYCYKDRIAKDNKADLLKYFDDLLESFLTNNIDQEGVPFNLTIPWMRRKISANKLLEAVNYYLECKDIIKKRSPDKILLCNSWSMYGFVSMIAAKEADIKAIVVPTHFTQISAIKEDLLRVCSSNLPEYWAVLGGEMRDILGKFGIKSSSIFSTSLPIFDINSDMSPSKKEVELLNRRLEKTNCKEFVVLTIQNYPEDESLIEDVINAMNDFPHLALIIRPHPYKYTQVGFVKKLKLKFKRRVIIEREISLHILIDNSRMLISLNSLTLFQAIVSGKPCISLTYYTRPTNYQFMDSDAIILVHSPNDIAENINSILNDRELQKVLEKGRDQIKNTLISNSEISSAHLLADAIEA